jgi:hypothetical protein
MSASYQIIIDVKLEDTTEPTPEVAQAIANLASVMEVQAEDGLYSAGYEEADNYEVDGETVENVFLSHIVETTARIRRIHD